MEHLDVSKNNLKIVGSDIGRLIELRYLNLAKNQLIGLPGEIGELWKLERLDLSENNIHGVGESIAAITRLPNLRILYLAQNPLTGIQELSNAALRSLDVSGCSKFVFIYMHRYFLFYFILIIFFILQQFQE